MNYIHLFKIELFYKVVSKIAGSVRSILILYLFGFSTTLDSHYLALSYVGFILSASVVFELLHMKNLQFALRKKNNEFILIFFYRFFFITIISSLLIFILLFFITNSNVMAHVIILIVWAIMYNLNSFLIVVHRLNSHYKTIGNYFLFTPIIVLLFIFFGYYWLDYNSALLVSTAILLSEVIMFYNLSKKLDLNIFTRIKLNYFSLNFSKKYWKILLKATSLIFFVYLIDVTDKTFAYHLGEGYTTVLTYGIWLPLMVRQALDIKSVFYHKIMYSKSIREDFEVLLMTTKWMSYFIIPVIVIGVALYGVVKFDYINNFVNITYDHFQDLLNVFVIYIIVLPIYIIWDMLYRVFYKNKQLDKLFFIMLFGVFANIGLNYIFIYIFEFKSAGIALSTCIVMFFYILISFNILRRMIK